MQFHHLRYFVYAVQLKSFNRAARNLDISPQALCAGVAALERELGYPLLHRSSSGVRPTANGEIIYEDAVKVLEVELRWKSLHPQSERESIELAANTTMMRWIVPRALLLLQASSPELEVILHESYVEKVFRAIVDKRLVGIITCVNERVEKLYQGRLAQSDLEATDMGDDPCVVVINRTNPLAKRHSLMLEDLRQLNLAWNPNRHMYFIYRDICRHFSPRPPLQIPDQDNLLRLISTQNDVAAVLPSSALKARGEWDKSVTSRNVDDFPMPGRTWLISPRKPSKNQVAVLRALTSVFREEQANQEKHTSWEQSGKS